MNLFFVGYKWYKKKRFIIISDCIVVVEQEIERAIYGVLNLTFLLIIPMEILQAITSTSDIKYNLY